MDRLVDMGKAANTIGVSNTTLRRVEAQWGMAAERTSGKHRRYDPAKLPQSKGGTTLDCDIEHEGAERNEKSEQRQTSVQIGVKNGQVPLDFSGRLIQSENLSALNRLAKVKVWFCNKS